MDDRLRLIRYLYDEEVDESALARRLSDDPDLYREYEELAATKRAWSTTWSTTAQTRSSDADAIPAWDDGEELIRIQRRIDRLQARSAPDRWGSLQRVSRP